MFLKYLFVTIITILLGVAITESCQDLPARKEPPRKSTIPDDPGLIAALPDSCKYPADNLYSLEKKELGRLLFYDPILSGGKDVACATCHHPEFGYAESLELSIGVNGVGLGDQRHFNPHNDISFTKRNSQSVLNTAFNGIDMNGNYDPSDAPMFWDLRAHSLEEQAALPIKTMEEMRGHGVMEANIHEVVVRRVNAIPSYSRLFAAAFPDSPGITIGLITKSIANFQRSLLANHSRFDAYMRGDGNALSTREVEGMQLFLSSGCARWHNGPMLSDYKVHTMGVAENEKLGFSDSGYQRSYAFRTPSLRNLRFTRPYMHSGKVSTLEDVLTFYEDIHGDELPNKHVNKNDLDPLAKKVNVEFKNINLIVEFLNSLNDAGYDRKIPSSVPSGLEVGGRIK
jgi:cytochrome c peroxidase